MLLREWGDGEPTKKEMRRSTDAFNLTVFMVLDLRMSGSKGAIALYLSDSGKRGGNRVWKVLQNVTLLE